MIRRHRMFLTAVAVAGSVALYGCGGGDSGPDQTPFDQKDVDKAAADAKRKVEEQAAAAAAAAAEAVTAAAEAMKAMEAADAAKKAADDAARYAMTATLDTAKAMAASASASAENEKASAAAKAARAAATKAATAASGHQAAMEAAMSAKAAEQHAMEAAASAASAMRSYETAKSVKDDRDVTADLAAAAGAHVQTAKAKADMASEEAVKAKAQVNIAENATTKKAAEDAMKAAQTASEAAAKAAADAATAADAIKSDAPAVATEKAAARKHAMDAMTSSGNAERYYKYTAGYANAREARELADEGKTDLVKRKNLMDRVKWISKAATTDGALDAPAKAALSAAQRLDGAKIEAVITARQNDIASALTAAEGVRKKAGDELQAAMDVYDAAKTFSENGMGIDENNLASGETLRHTSGKISLNFDDARVFAVDQEITEQGELDTIIRFWGAITFGGLYTPPAATAKKAKYKAIQINRRAPGRSGLYNYIYYGIWGRADGGFNTASGALPTEVMAEVNTFVFADTSNRAKDMPITGSAEYRGIHYSTIQLFTGNKGTGAGAGNTPVITGGTLLSSASPAITPVITGAGAWFGTVLSGDARTVIDFSKDKVDLYLDNAIDQSNILFYDIKGITLNRSTSTFSGGTYNVQGTTGRSRGSDNKRLSDPFRNGAATFVPKVNLHGGVFGPQSNEIAGTIELSASVPHGETVAADAAKAKDGTITVHTVFGGRNTGIPSGG